MGCKAVETTFNINKAFYPGTGNKHTVQWWFKKFCKGDKSLEDEEHSGHTLKVYNLCYRSHYRAITEADPLTTTQEVVQEFNIGVQCSMPFYSHLAFEANWKGEKAQ